MQVEIIEAIKENSTQQKDSLRSTTGKRSRLANLSSLAKAKKASCSNRKGITTNRAINRTKLNKLNKLNKLTKLNRIISLSPSSKGFSLIELLIVIVIISIIAAISVPNLLSTKRSANSASAVQTLRLISSSQAAYSTGVGSGEYATVDDLVREQFIDESIGAASIPSLSTTQQPKSGYIFVFNRTNTLANYEVSARPLFTNGLTASGNKSLFVDASAVIRFSPSASAPFADANSQPLN
jgi:prepilin-type N-terminal cleavage/methylation domain-containing protein